MAPTFFLRVSRKRPVSVPCSACLGFSPFAFLVGPLEGGPAAASRSFTILPLLSAVRVGPKRLPRCYIVLRPPILFFFWVPGLLPTYSAAVLFLRGLWPLPLLPIRDFLNLRTGSLFEVHSQGTQWEPLDVVSLLLPPSPSCPCF